MGRHTVAAYCGPSRALSPGRGNTGGADVCEGRAPCTAFLAAMTARPAPGALPLPTAPVLPDVPVPVLPSAALPSSCAPLDCTDTGLARVTASKGLPGRDLDPIAPSPSLPPGLAQVVVVVVVLLVDLQLGGGSAGRGVPCPARGLTRLAARLWPGSRGRS